MKNYRIIVNQHINFIACSQVIVGQIGNFQSFSERLIDFDRFILHLFSRRWLLQSSKWLSRINAPHLTIIEYSLKFSPNLNFNQVFFENHKYFYNRQKNIFSKEIDKKSNGAIQIRNNILCNTSKCLHETHKRAWESYQTVIASKKSESVK